jgi:hypothetical protein
MTVAVSDCSSTTASPAAACHLNSDCLAPLICALGACRKQCVTAADCISFGAGSSCVSDSKGHAICQPVAELNTPCDNESMCTPPLACASDYRCRNICNVDGDCNVDGITGRVCATVEASFDLRGVSIVRISRNAKSFSRDAPEFDAIGTPRFLAIASMPVSS